MRRLAAGRRGELLQWFALFGGALAWTAQLVFGFGLTIAKCGAARGQLGVEYHTWQISAMVAAALVVGLALIAGIVVALATRELEHEGPPPGSRRYFFALAAVAGNILFLGVVLLSGIASVTHTPCVQG